MNHARLPPLDRSVSLRSDSFQPIACVSEGFPFRKIMAGASLRPSVSKGVWESVDLGGVRHGIDGGVTGDVRTGVGVKA
jgi:hypothetical protein